MIELDGVSLRIEVRGDVGANSRMEHEAIIAPPADRRHCSRRAGRRQIKDLSAAVAVQFEREMAIINPASDINGHGVPMPVADRDSVIFEL